MRNDMDGKNDSSSTLISFFVATVLLVAIGFSLSVMTDSYASHKFSSGARIFVEWVIAIWLLHRYRSELSCHVAIALFSIFLFIAGWKLVKGQADCGCFGSLKIPPAATVLLDFIVLVALAFFKSVRRSFRWSSSRSMGRLLFGLTLPIAISLGETSYRHKNVTVLDPMSWIGKPFPLMSSISNPEPLNIGEHLIVLYDHDCEHCWKHLITLASIEQDAIHHRTIWTLDIAEHVAKNQLVQISPFPELLFSKDRTYFATVPVDIYVTNGMVANVFIP